MKALKTVAMLGLLVACTQKTVEVQKPTLASTGMRPSEIRDFCAPYLKDNADMWDECMTSLSTPLPKGVDPKNHYTWPSCQKDEKFGDITPKSVKTVCVYGDEEFDQ